MMKKNIIAIVALLMLGFNIQACSLNKSDIKVLIVAHNPAKVFKGGYAGPPATERQDKMARTRGKEFKALLDPYFKQVDIVNSDEYKAELSNQYDVTIFDDLPEPIEQVDLGKYLRGESIVRGGKPMMYSRYLPKNFDRAIIGIGQLTDNLTVIYQTKLTTQ